MFFDKGNKNKPKNQDFKLFNTNNQTKYPIFGNASKTQQSVFQINKPQQNKTSDFNIFNVERPSTNTTPNKGIFNTANNTPNKNTYQNNKTPMKNNNFGNNNIWGGALTQSNKQNNISNNIIADFRKEFEEKNKKIDMLENQVKYLTQGLTMCMNFINEVKNHNQYQNIQNNSQIAPVLRNNNNFQSNPINTLNNNINKQIFGNLTYKSDTQLIFKDKQFNIHIENNYKLQEIKNLKIQNQFAKIIFNEALNLTTIQSPPSEWLEMNNNNVKVLKNQLKNKKCEIFIQNFMNYKNCENPQQLQNIIDQVQKAKLLEKFQIVQFDFNNGFLYIKCKGL